MRGLKLDETFWVSLGFLLVLIGAMWITSKN